MEYIIKKFKKISFESKIKKQNNEFQKMQNIVNNSYQEAERIYGHVYLLINIDNKKEIKIRPIDIMDNEEISFFIDNHYIRFYFDEIREEIVCYIYKVEEIGKKISIKFNNENLLMMIPGRGLTKCKYIGEFLSYNFKIIFPEYYLLKEESI